MVRQKLKEVITKNRSKVLFLTYEYLNNAILENLNIRILEYQNIFPRYETKLSSAIIGSSPLFVTYRDLFTDIR